ncbi:hypothetical protein ACGFIJ_15120 [Microbispora bryophytorum]|uniref:hypothetical protein n=1 Tax=Microbispora bryophytorum TaxID=1460882 RepID=UPI003724A2B7
MGNIADLRRLVGRTPDGWLRVLLWVSREVTERRSQEWGDADTAQRLTAWDETLADLTANTDEGFFHMHIGTGRMGANIAAGEMTQAFRALERAAALGVRRRENTGVHRRGRDRPAIRCRSRRIGRRWETRHRTR